MASALSKSEYVPGGLDNQKATLSPPFDLIITSDTVYKAELTTPLLRSIHHILHLSHSSVPPPSKRTKHAFPPVYVALENRDPQQTASFLREAQERWSLSAKKVPMVRLRRSLGRSGLGEWKSEDWRGVEVWQMCVIKEVQSDAGSKQTN